MARVELEVTSLGRRARSILVDAGDDASVAAAFERAKVELGAPEVLVYNAGARGTILLTAATASLRGSANFACLAVGKFGLRALAQSMARQLSPLGIHVAHVVIDGQIDADGVLRRGHDTRAEWRRRPRGDRPLTRPQPSLDA